MREREVERFFIFLLFFSCFLFSLLSVLFSELFFVCYLVYNFLWYIALGCINIFSVIILSLLYFLVDTVYCSFLIIGLVEKVDIE